MNSSLPAPNRCLALFSLRTSWPLAPFAVKGFFRSPLDQFNQSRAFVLELMVVVILIIELVMLFRGKPGF
jgi:hypothetical protein